ncbi:MAG: succinyl-diaminopimelate desuccinylase [Pseudomonadota bacterium]
MTHIDPVILTQELIKCPSVTPAEGGALQLLEALLTQEGFACTRISRGGVENIHARWGNEGPVLGFGGHTDVVPTGDEGLWTHAPFSGALTEDGILWGRGAVDMKSGVAAFVAAAIEQVRTKPPAGSIALLITGDEEGPSQDGTRAILDWMAEAGEGLDFCIVGEPTSLARVGDTVKIGRRGSMTGTLTVRGSQGHTAYPERAVNPLPVLAQICVRLADQPIDLGSTHFQPSTLALTTMDVGNPASNVIPAEGRAVFNIRFNDTQTSDSIMVWVDQIVRAISHNGPCEAEVDWHVSGESFLTQPGPLTDVVVDAVTDLTLERPALTTGGGTSDARFIKDICPVVELGLVGDTMHQTNERVPSEDIRTLTGLYAEIIDRFFG